MHELAKLWPSSNREWDLLHVILVDFKAMATVVIQRCVDIMSKIIMMSTYSQLYRGYQTPSSWNVRSTKLLSIFHPVSSLIITVFVFHCCNFTMCNNLKGKKRVYWSWMHSIFCCARNSICSILGTENTPVYYIYSSLIYMHL